MKLAIIGSRSFGDYARLCATIDTHWGRSDHGHGGTYPYWLIDEVISGGAVGADQLGARWAKEHGVKLTEIKPRYDLHPPKLAPLIRNEEIVEAADHVLAFHDGVSRGTLNALGHAQRLKRPTLIVYF